MFRINDDSLPEHVPQAKLADEKLCCDRRRFLHALAWVIGAGMAPELPLQALAEDERCGAPRLTAPEGAVEVEMKACFNTKKKVPDPTQIEFSVQYLGKAPITLVGHFWYNEESIGKGMKCPAIVELNPYRRRDGMMLGDSSFHPWLAYNDYLCFRVDLQGSGDSEGVLTDEYTDEELVYCTQVIRQIAEHPYCNGNVGMMGKSWSAINSLMVAARSDCPAALKAVLIMCGTDDRFNDDVHYSGGAMLQDNVGWPSSMWGWLSLPPDPVVVGDRWRKLWRTRIRNADFWFKTWAAHQTRDAYWSDTSVRDHYERVRVPVYIVSGYQDNGYNAPVPRVVSGIAAAGMPVQGLLGPWGHARPDIGYPGPRIDWLPYLVTHWWDKWLKGIQPDPETELPQLTVWLGESKEPEESTCKNEKGRWVAEDAGWQTRVREKVFYLTENKLLSGVRPTHPGELVGSKRLVLHTRALESASWGHCGNNDLPGDQSQADSASIAFDTDPLSADMDCFGYPVANVNLSCDKPVVVLAVRLCEVSPITGASHLVSYRFFNLCYRAGDMASPKHIEPGTVFNVRIPLNVLGHTFKQGWRIRLSLSASYFPTMWQSPEKAVVTVHTGPVQGSRPSSLSLPRRKPRTADLRLKQLLPDEPQILCVDSEKYIPTEVGRPEKNTRRVKWITVGSQQGLLVEKLMDSGRYRYGGPLEDLWVDQVAEENFLIVDEDPLSLSGFTESKAVLERRKDGKTWKIRSQTVTQVWTEKEPTGGYVFKYKATLRTFIANRLGEFDPFERKTVEGAIPRLWL